MILLYHLHYCIARWWGWFWASIIEKFRARVGRWSRNLANNRRSWIHPGSEAVVVPFRFEYAVLRRIWSKTGGITIFTSSRQWSHLWPLGLDFFHQPVFPRLCCHPSLQPAQSWAVIVLLLLLKRIRRFACSQIWAMVCSWGLKTRTDFNAQSQHIGIKYLTKKYYRRAKTKFANCFQKQVFIL